MRLNRKVLLALCVAISVVVYISELHVIGYCISPGGFYCDKETFSFRECRQNDKNSLEPTDGKLSDNVRSECDSRAKCNEKIEGLLRMHDDCVNSRMYPDSAVVYTVKALELADSCFGFNSKRYGDIFIDYMIPDCRDNKQLLCEYIYPVVSEVFNPFADWVWRAYYKLGTIMEQLGELEKAKNLYSAVINASAPIDYILRARIFNCNLNRSYLSAPLEQDLHHLTEDVNQLPSPEKEELLFLMAKLIAKDYILRDDVGKAMEFIGYCERMEGHVSSHLLMDVLRLKHDLLLKSDHVAAVECLEKIIQIASSENEDPMDKDWIAVALVERGDYAWNEQVNINEACGYYMRAYKLVSGYADIRNPALKAVARRLIFMLKMDGDYDEAIALCEGLATFVRPEQKETDLWYINDLLELYVVSGRIAQAAELFSRYREQLMASSSTINKAMLLEGQLKLADGKASDAARCFERLLNRHLPKDIRMWAERCLSTAYYKLGDDRLADVSDSVNGTAKRIVKEQLWFISPSQRVNWLKVCEEAMMHQLSLRDSTCALRNAAEMNLIKKSLLFRTSRQLERIINNIPEAAADVEKLKSLKRKILALENRGDTTGHASIVKEVEACEQRLVYRYVDQGKMAYGLDVGVSDIVSILDGRSAAIDFLVHERHGEIKVGAFVYKGNAELSYVDLVHCRDSLPFGTEEMIWSKILPMVNQCDEVFFCTDGILNDVALEYSKCADGKPVNDLFRIHRVFHLAELKKSSEIGDKIVFVGVSDHNSPFKSGGEIQRGSWSDLENVGMECEMIRNRIDPQCLTTIVDDDATEGCFLSLDGSDVSTLHISTHGVYRDENTIEKASRDPASEDYNIARRLLAAGKTSLSGLILRRGNLSWKRKEIMDDYDDILTSEEIEQMNFPNLQLTVLSACDTGLGDIDEEGVWGLQRAFRIAGTKSLICSLRKVDDYWTAQFMDAFYEQAVQGKTIYDSFHTAQRWLRHELPDNPEIWTSFILIE